MRQCIGYLQCDYGYKEYGLERMDRGKNTFPPVPGTKLCGVKIADTFECCLKLDNQFERYYQIRKHRIQQRGEGLIRVLQDGHNPKVGGGGLAGGWISFLRVYRWYLDPTVIVDYFRLVFCIAIELVHELAAYLSTRYPTDFVVTRHERQVVEALSVPLPSRASATTRFCDWGWDGALPIKSITVEGLKVTYELPLHVADGEKAPERALEIAALLYVQ